MGPSDGTQANSIAESIQEGRLRISTCIPVIYICLSTFVRLLLFLISVVFSLSAQVIREAWSSLKSPRLRLPPIRSALLFRRITVKAQRAHGRMIGGRMLHCWGDGSSCSIAGISPRGGCRSVILIARWQGFGQRLRDLSIILSESSLARH
jgi:hypothetical protein